MVDASITEFPLEIFSFKCFDKTGSGEFSLKAVNFVIGRNNTGKSAVVDFLEVGVCGLRPLEPLKHCHKGEQLKFRFKKILTESEINALIPHGIRTNQGMTYDNVRNRFVGEVATFESNANKNLSLVEISQPQNVHNQIFESAVTIIRERIRWPFNDVGLIRVSAERDVQPEALQAGQEIKANGEGLTNAIARQINDASLPRELIEETVLADLNEVYLGDAEFTEILTRIDEHNNWEVFVKEQGKGDVRLSESGSGLKTILLVICLIRLTPKPQWTHQMLAIDEPENNLHPALFRRLLEYLARMRDDYGFILVVTTHSPIAIDWAARREDSQVIHVRHDGQRAKLSVAGDYLAGRDILDDLDIRASDLLQANGIIWVEGPSDRIYLRRWIEIHSGGALKEGIHYTIMFYGGKLLSHLSADTPDTETDLIALLSMNRNAALLIDSDRRLASISASGKARKPRMHINGTKKRIKDELEKLDGLVWITKGKEVENYIPIEVYAALVDKSAPAVSEFDDIVGHPLLTSFKEDKIKLAHAATAELQTKDIDNILDLKSQLEQLSQHIRRWNGIAD